MLLGFQSLRNVVIPLGLKAYLRARSHVDAVVLASQHSLRDRCRAQRKLEIPG